MEKEKILSTIGEQLGQTSFSQRTLELYVDLNPLAEGAEPDETYFGNAVKFLKGMEGQYNHDVATKVEDFKKNYKPSTQEPPKADEPPTANKELEEMKKQIDELLNAQKKADEQKNQEELMKKVKAGMKAKNASDAYVLDKTLQGVVLDGSKGVPALVEEMLAKYDTEFTACRGEGAAPRNSQNQQGGAKGAVDSYFARKAKKEGWGKKE